VYLIKHLNILK